MYGEAICETLVARGLINIRYSIATEHEHSCCILLAREDKFKVNYCYPLYLSSFILSPISLISHDKFKVNDVWHTWIDYPRFNQLIQQYYASDGAFTFNSSDYIAPTPSWAVYQSEEKGFSPNELRWRRNKTTGAIQEIDYVASESGCG